MSCLFYKLFFNILLTFESACFPLRVRPGIEKRNKIKKFIFKKIHLSSLSLYPLNKPYIVRANYLFEVATKEYFLFKFFFFF